MSYGRISSTKKGISLGVSLLIHLMIMAVFAMSLQNLSEKPLNKEFDLYAIKLLDMKPMAQNQVNTKGDTKSGKMVRKKKSNKTFPQKGTRQALAPKAPVESLKKAASDPLIENKNTSLPKLTVQQQQINKLDKATEMASVEKRQTEWKKKLVFNRPKELAKLEKSSLPKEYTQRLKSVNKKQITPLKPTSNQYAKVQSQRLDQLRRTQKPTLPTRSSQLKMNLAEAQTHLPQRERKIQLARLMPNQRQDRISQRINYQQKQVTSEPVVISQRKVSYNTRSVPVIKKTAISPNQFMTEVTQTITRVREVRTVTQMVKRTTTISRVNPTPVINRNFVVKSVPAKSMEKQAKLATTAPQQNTQLKRTVSYQQKQTRAKPVELTQARVSYQQQMVNRQVTGPTTLDVAASTQPQVAQPQTLQTMNRQRTSVEPTPRTNEAVLTSDLALEPIPMRVMEKRAKLATTAPQQKTQALRTVSYQQKQTQAKPVELTQARVSYQQQVVNRQVTGPTSLDVATPAQPQVAQPQTLQTMNRQRTSVEPTPRTNEAVLSSKSILEDAPQREFTGKQVQVAKLESSTQEFVVKKKLKFEQRSTSTSSTRVIQQRVAYQQASQGVAERSLDQPTNLIGTMAEMGEPAELQEMEAQLATISRQEHTTSVPTSSDNSILETQRYATQEKSNLEYTKSSNSSNLSAAASYQPQAVGQERRLAAYTQDKSKSKIGVGSSSKGTSGSLQGSPTSPMLSSKGRAAAGEKNAPVIRAKVPSGNTTRETLYRLRGEIEGGVKQAFVTVNEVTQLIQVVNGEFEVEIAMVKGINQISILAFDSRGGVGKQLVKLLYTPPPGVPLVALESPENGKQGVKEGDPIIVAGTIDDHSITRATLYLNGIPIRMKVVNGRFQKKVFLPNTRITTFRVMARNKNRDGPPGYSVLHTILSGYDIDITNPRPY